MKVRYKKKICEVIQEYGDVLVIKYNNRTVSVLKEEVKIPKSRKKKSDESRDTVEDRDARAARAI